MMNYDIKNVNIFLNEIKANGDDDIFYLLLQVIYDEKYYLNDHKIDNKYLNNRFNRLTNWEKSNFLFRIGDDVKKIVKRKAKYYEAIARKEEKVEKLEKDITSHIHDYMFSKISISDLDFDLLCNELKNLNPESKILKSMDFLKLKNSSDIKEMKRRDDDRKSKT